MASPTALDDDGDSVLKYMKHMRDNDKHDQNHLEMEIYEAICIYQCGAPTHHLVS